MQPTRMDAEARPSAYAKAKVIQDLLAVANRAGLSDSAQLLVAHLLSISRPHDDGWTCYISNETLANRLAKNEGTIRRIIIQVQGKLGDVVIRIPGDIRGRSSTYLIRVRELSERASALSPERASAQIRDLSERASAPPYSSAEFNNNTSTPDVVVVAPQQRRDQEQTARWVLPKDLSQSQQEAFRAIRSHKWWRNERYIRIDEEAAARLAMLNISVKDIHAIASLVNGYGDSAINPPGLFKRKLEQFAARISEERKEGKPCHD